MAAPQGDLPPSYDDSIPTPQPGAAQQPTQPTPSSLPPTYTTVANTPQRSNLPISNESLTLYLVGSQVSSSHDPSKPLYILNRPPTTGFRDVYHVSRVRYTLSSTTGEGRIRQREKRIYDFWSNFKTSVDIAGKCGASVTYKGVHITSYSTLWSSCSVKEHFSCGRSIRARFSKKDTGLEWKNLAGDTLAVEYRADESAPPRLEMRTVLGEKEMDLLVTCWCARVFRENVDVGRSRDGGWEEIKNKATAHMQKDN